MNSGCVPTVGTDPRFIAALAELVRGESLSAAVSDGLPKLRTA